MDADGMQARTRERIQRHPPAILRTKPINAARAPGNGEAVDAGADGGADAEEEEVAEIRTTETEKGEEKGISLVPST